MGREDPLRVYFACVGNSGRSQMAEAFCRELGATSVACHSGGTEPLGSVLATVGEAMAEAGIEVTDQESTPIDEAAVREAALVVTMGCGADACPAFDAVEVLDWPLADPKGKSLAEVRAIRDEIRSRVRQLLAERGALAADPGRSVP